jgi:hypothetical protein
MCVLVADNIKRPQDRVSADIAAICVSGYRTVIRLCNSVSKTLIRRNFCKRKVAVTALLSGNGLVSLYNHLLDAFINCEK